MMYNSHFRIHKSRFTEKIDKSEIDRRLEEHRKTPNTAKFYNETLAYNRIVVMHASQAENDASIIRSLIADLKKLKG